MVLKDAVAVLREARWLSPRRAHAYVRIVLAVTIALVLGALALSRNGLDPTGKPLGTDFISFWTASKLALAGDPAAAYDSRLHGEAQRALFKGVELDGYTAFFYPPVFLLICLPLAALPYLASLAAWLGATGYAYWRTMRAILPGSGMGLAILAYPAVLLNAGHGQNGFLTTALLGAGALAMRGRPVLAGLCFGCLVYKPHLALAVPVALLAARRWTSLIAAGASALALCGLSAAVLGFDTWRAFLAAAPLARAALEQDWVGPEKMPSVFAAIRLLNGPVVMAYGAQCLATAAALGVVAAFCRTRPEPLAMGAVMAAAAPLASPFLLDYDLVLLAIPLGWMLGQAQRTGFLPWEKSALLAGFALPWLARAIATHAGVPIGPLVVLALFAAVLRRAWIAGRQGSARMASACPPETTRPLSQSARVSMASLSKPL